MFDLDAIAVDDHAELFQFQFAGETWTFKPIDELDVWVLPELRRGEFETALPRMFADVETELAELQYARFRARKLTRRQLDALCSAYYQSQGTTAGESPASSDSVTSTGTPSKRTSPRRTGKTSAR